MSVRILTLIGQILADQPIRNWVFQIGVLIVLALAVRTIPAIINAEKPNILISFGMAVPIMVVVIVAVLVFQTPRE